MGVVHQLLEFGKKPPNSKDGVVFPGVQKSTWSFDKEARRWYFHRFYDFQPDLDTSNPWVHAELLKIMGFWVRLGVSGFRMDAVPFVIAAKGPEVREHTEQYGMLRAFREFLQWREGNAIILAEANVLPDTDFKYFGDAGERLPMMFNFQLNQNTFYTLATHDTKPLKHALFVHNFSAEACTVKFRSGCNEPGDERLINVLSDDHSQAGDDGRHVVVLEPYGYRWYRVGPLDYLLRRTEV
jgi:glycosidase